MLQTDDTSALAGGRPAVATQPKVVQWVIENVSKMQDVHFDASVPGELSLAVGRDLDSYDAFDSWLKRKDRNYPIVLISPAPSGKYAVDPEKLRSQVVGLADVVRLTSEFNSYDLAAAVGKDCSAWSGAINLISTPYQDGTCRTFLFLSRDLETWGQSENERRAHLFNLITDKTNIPHLRERVRPDAILRLRLSRELQRARASGASQEVKLQALQGTSAEYQDLFDLADQENRAVAAERDALKQDLECTRRELSQYRSDNDALKLHLDQARSPLGASNDAQELLAALCAAQAPNAEQCITWIGRVYANQCVILDEAYRSAKDSRFEDGRKLLDLLLRLVTRYRTALAQGPGDAEARSIFGRDEFKAVESESVMRTPRLRKYRLFNYHGEPMEMFSHLAIGVRDSDARTIRVHFGWDSAAQKIVIGHCGRHLPLS